MPQTRSEREIAGYRDALSTIHEGYDSIPPRPFGILQLHRDLYKYRGKAIGRSYKNADNLIVREDEAGDKAMRFRWVPARDVSEAVERACAAFDETQKNPELDLLLLIPMFILDFLCMHPFNNGSGRMSRLLTLLLLCRAGYFVGKYISFEKLVEQSKESYYETLRESPMDWHTTQNDYFPFVRYMLGAIVAAYRDFSGRVQLLTTSGLPKPQRIRAIIKDTLGKITKTEIMQQCPDIAQATVQRALNELVKSGEIQKLSGGRYTAYTWNGERK